MESKIEPHLPTYPPHSSGALPTPSHSSELSAIPPPSAPRSMALLGTPPSSSPFHRTPRHSFPPLLDSSPLRGASPCPPSLILAATAEKLRPRSGRGRDAALRGVQSLHCSAWWRGDTRAVPTGRANIDEGGSGGSQAFKSRPECRGTLGVDRWQCPHLGSDWRPIRRPTRQLKRHPNRQPSAQPTSHSMGRPTKQPMGQQTTQPTRHPTRLPTKPPGGSQIGPPWRASTLASHVGCAPICSVDEERASDK